VNRLIRNPFYGLRTRCVCRSQVSGKRYIGQYIYTCVYACESARRERWLQKDLGGIDLPRVREVMEFRRTLPNAASRPRRGRERNIVRADACEAHNVGGNVERLLLQIMSIRCSTKDEKLRNNLKEILFLYHPP